MRLDPDTGAVILSKRNLLALLSKVDREGSARTLVGGSRAPGIVVQAEPDEEHYADVPFTVAVAPEDDPGIESHTTQALTPSTVLIDVDDRCSDLTT